jgi:hypothetical protein
MKNANGKFPIVQALSSLLASGEYTCKSSEYCEEGDLMFAKNIANYNLICSQSIIYMVYKYDLLLVFVSLFTPYGPPYPLLCNKYTGRGKLLGEHWAVLGSIGQVPQSSRFTFFVGVFCVH